jgi:hypothetical protein
MARATKQQEKLKRIRTKAHRMRMKVPLISRLPRVARRTNKINKPSKPLQVNRMMEVRQAMLLMSLEMREILKTVRVRNPLRAISYHYYY